MTTAVSTQDVERVLAERRRAVELAEAAAVRAELQQQAEAEALRAKNLKQIEEARAAAVAALGEAAPLIAEVERLVEQLVDHARRLTSLHRLVDRGHEREVWGNQHGLGTEVRLPAKMPIDACVITRIVGVTRALAKVGNLSVELAQTRAMQSEL